MDRQHRAVFRLNNDLCNTGRDSGSDRFSRLDGSGLAINDKLQYYRWSLISLRCRIVERYDHNEPHANSIVDRLRNFNHKFETASSIKCR